MKTTEGNKLIAEFMGCPYHKNDTDCEYYEVWAEELIPIDSLEYHTSWDWLMPVVEKIGDRNLLSLDIKDVLDGVIEHIEWYNTQNK